MLRAGVRSRLAAIVSLLFFGFVCCLALALRYMQMTLWLNQDPHHLHSTWGRSAVRAANSKK